MTPRVPKAAISTEMTENMIKQLGAVPEPVEVMWNNPQVALDNLEFGGKVGAWGAADESLKSFAHMAVAAQVGCSWCLDIGYFQAQNQNLDLAKASQVPRWRAMLPGAIRRSRACRMSAGSSPGTRARWRRTRGRPG